MNTPVRRMVGLVVALLALLAACGTGPEAPETNAGPSTAAPADGVADQLRFTATTLDGERFSGEDLAGKPAVLWFWTPWCAICQHEAPFIADMAKVHGDKATFVGVAAQDQVGAMRGFAERFGIGDFTNLNDKDAAVWARFGVTAQPAFAFVSANGRVERVNGTVTEQEIVRWLDTRAQS